MTCNCASTPPPPPTLGKFKNLNATDSKRTQILLLHHNAQTPMIKKSACIAALEHLLDSLTGSQYVFIGFSPEPWATGGKQALFVPFQSRLGSRNQVVTFVIDDFCKVEGLIWPE